MFGQGDQMGFKAGQGPALLMGVCPATKQTGCKARWALRFVLKLSSHDILIPALKDRKKTSMKLSRRWGCKLLNGACFLVLTFKSLLREYSNRKKLLLAQVVDRVRINSWGLDTSLVGRNKGKKIQERLFQEMNRNG